MMNSRSFSILLFIFFTLNINLAKSDPVLKSDCSDRQLKRLEKIDATLNQDEKGLDFESDLEDIKLHLAYRTSLRKSCSWNETLQIWLDSEKERMINYAKKRKEQTKKLQEKWLERSEKNNAKGIKTYQEKKDIFYYVGVHNVAIKEFDLSKMTNDEKEDYVNGLKQRLKSNYQQTDVVYDGYKAVLYQQSIVLGYYQLDGKGDDQLGVSLVKVSMNNLEGDLDALLTEYAETTFKKISQKMGLPLNVMIKYKKIFFVVDYSTSMADNYIWRKFVETLEQFAKNLNIEITFAAVERKKEGKGHSVIVGNKISHLSFEEVNKLAVEGRLLLGFDESLANAIYERPQDDETLVIYLGDGQCYHSEDNLNEEKKIISKYVKGQIVYKKFFHCYEQDNTYFNSVARPDIDIVFEPGLIPISDEEIQEINRLIKYGYIKM